MIPTLSRQQAYNKRNKNNNEQISIQKIEKNVIGMYISENRQKNRKKSHKSSRRMPKTVRNIFPLQQKNILNIRDAL